MSVRPVAVALLAALLLLLAPAHARADDAMRAVPLTDGERIRLDGRIDHPAWRRAPVYDRFVEHSPRSGAEPPQTTRVRLLFDRLALYVGIDAQDSDAASIRRPMVRNDQVNRTQDFVVVYVDPIGTRRSAQFFRVNAAGSLADGMHTASDDSEDFAPDFDWDAAVASHAGGWTAVLRLPLASLRYAAGGQDRWRIMVARRLPREQFHLLTSVPVPRESASFIDHLQPLAGVRLPAEPGFLVLRPGLTLRSSRPAGGATAREPAADASLDLKWRPRAELVVDATLNPDFSQVALDVPQLSGNTRFALSIAEKRPFFFESADLLRTPTEAFYTRSLTAPRGGLRATWRGSRLAGSVLLVDDRGGGLVLLPGPYGTGAAEQPPSRALAARGRSDEGALRWGAVLASRRYDGGRGNNSVLGPDLNWTLDDGWRLSAQWLHSRTSALADGRGGLQRAPPVDGDRLFVRVDRKAPGRESTYTLDDIGAGFRHDGGFVSQAGVRTFSLSEGLGWRPLAPFNELWLNLNVSRTEQRGRGRTIEQRIVPGLWSAAARNLEWWLELHLLNQLRVSPDGPLLAQRFLSTGLVLTPAPWFPLLDSQLQLGRLADADDERLRPGARWTTTARLRPLPRLELEPGLSTSWLRGDGVRAYDERVLSVLAVWHLAPRCHLRLIVQRTGLRRDATELDRLRADSLTWSWRLSSGTQFHVGASRTRSGLAATAPDREVFVKLQFDLDDARGRLGARN